MEWGLLFLLLPIAAFSGWLVGRKGSDSRERQACTDLNAGYIKGLNYLLNEQSDKAIEVFVQMLEVDSETVETHFALGNLFLKRGEVDRAIRIHQNLIARPTLTRLQRQQALFELGKDYLRAGLLDRAESLFIQSSENNELAPLAQKHLLEVYELEKEWRQAIEVARRLYKSSSAPELQPVIAHYLCEEAEEARRDNREREAMRLAKAALEEDKNSVRATLLQAQLAIEHQQFQNAAGLLQRIEQQDVAFIPESYPLLHECYRRLDKEQELIPYLNKQISAHMGGSKAVLLRAELLEKHQDAASAITSLIEYLKERPSLPVMKRLLELKIHGLTEKDSADLVLLESIIENRMASSFLYQCRSCGFATKTRHWQCPTCKEWGAVKPLQGGDGDA